MKQFIFLIFGCLLLTAFSTDENEPVVALTMHKMIVYKGFPYPITIEAQGIPDDELEVVGIECTITKKASGRYIMKPQPKFGRTGFCKVEVYYKNKLVKSSKFNIVRYPEPRPTVGRVAQDNVFTPATFKKQVGLSLPIVNYDIGAACATRSFTINRITRLGHREFVYNKGGRFTEDALSLVNKAAMGDIYIFDGIMYQCFGDESEVLHWATKVVRIN